MKIPKKCLMCNKPFHTYQSKESEGKGKFCSKPCFYSHRKRESTTNCVICQKEFFIRPSRVKKSKEGNCCSKQCHSFYMRDIGSKRVIQGFLDNNRNMKTGCGITTDGYVWIYKKGEFNNQIKLHRYVMELKLGRKLLPTEIVHHIDYNKLNNVIENLQVVSISEHNKIHKLGRIMK